MSKKKSSLFLCERPIDPIRAAQLLGQHIRTARRNSGRPLHELAPRAGLTADEWLLIEAGETLYIWEQICLIAMALDLDDEWLSSAFPLYLALEEQSQ
jgi:hypothetical protein